MEKLFPKCTYGETGKGSQMTETGVCPVCDRRVLDVRRDKSYEVVFRLKCPHCGKIVKITMPAIVA
ncbi:hypothetical protein D3Z45_19215 [Lachnospiraceae bacterium]|nr:hypothetical protein [Lachnospiraceae bacterium]